MKIHTPGVLPFSTNNAALAFALYSAGIPFADPRKPCRNIYSAEILFRIGGGEKDEVGNVTRPSRYAGMAIDQAAEQAFSEGEKGRIEYIFQRTKGISKLCEAFADQEREFKEKDIAGSALLDEIKKKVEDNAIPQNELLAALASINLIGPSMLSDIIKKMTDGTMSQQEGSVRLAYVTLKMRGALMNQWKQRAPMVKIDNPGKVKSYNLPGGGIRDVHPGFKIYDINLSEKKRKHIGL